ncbi:MAG: DNA polymerase III subunit gamma/tau [Solirubrobacteraceae bacterium]|nr:DNA polymerase III subunit gamma/tau [Solirubrobacteraceae bacterium]
MSAGPSLYRRHRPRTFADVVGQEHVVRTLSNAIEQGKVHHAYLFVGSRGTGKTSTAKILAACLNCEQGPTTSPCGQCESCLSIQQATSMDVIEMDAASHNSVDDIRELRESVAFAPVSGRSKVYILDEAHMLTPQAWNAFLKTLEEPPPNTIFVLATTEAQKVLPTVVDRCHRFDFGRPSVEQLTVVLQRVVDEEQIEIAPDALALIARHATGSFRDALGTLEQLVTYTGNRIAVEDVLAVLGVADDDLLFGALDAVAAHDARSALEAAAALAQAGRDLQVAARDLEVHARELLVVRTLGAVPAELRVTADRDRRLEEQALRIPEADVVRLLDLLASAMRAIRDGSDARTQIELALVKAATPSVDASTKALLARIARLEGGEAPPAPSAPPAPPPATEAAGEPAPQPPEAPEPEPQAQAAAGATAAAEPAPQPLAETQAPEPGPATVPVAIGIDEVAELWPAVVETLQSEQSLLAAALAGARPVEVRSDGTLVVAFGAEDSFNRRMAAENSEHRQAVTEAVHSLTGSPMRIEYETRELEGGPAPVELAGDELVDRIVATFDAEEIAPQAPSPGEAPAEPAAGAAPEDERLPEAAGEE